MLQLYLEEENTADMILIEDKLEVVKSQDLDGNFIIFAQDQAQTPLSESVKKREFIQSIPTLQGLGVPATTLLRELVRSLNLPEDFVRDAEENMRQQAQAAQQRVSAAAARTTGEAIQPDATEQALSVPTGPANLQGVLPGAGSIS
jgi:hypothetical protein